MQESILAEQLREHLRAEEIFDEATLCRVSDNGIIELYMMCPRSHEQILDAETLWHIVAQVRDVSEFLARLKLEYTSYRTRLEALVAAERRGVARFLKPTRLLRGRTTRR